MTQRIKAKFVGDEGDTMTRFLGLREGVKYSLEIVEAGTITKLFSRVSFYAVYRRGQHSVYKIPYESRKAFLRNWKIYRKGGGQI